MELRKLSPPKCNVLLPPLHATMYVVRVQGTVIVQLLMLVCFLFLLQVDSNLSVYGLGQGEVSSTHFHRNYTLWIQNETSNVLQVWTD